MERDRERHQLAVGRRAQARVIAVAMLLCVAAALSLFAAALRAHRGQQDVDAAYERELQEQLASVPEVDSAASGDAARILGGTEPSIRESGREVVDESAEVLADYGRRSDCVLARSGYLGLFDGAWSCLVLGGDWAEICMVTSAQDGGSEVRTWRITGAEVESLGDG